MGFTNLTSFSSFGGYFSYLRHTHTRIVIKNYFRALKWIKIIIRHDKKCIHLHFCGSSRNWKDLQPSLLSPSKLSSRLSSSPSRRRRTAVVVEEGLQIRSGWCLEGSSKFSLESKFWCLGAPSLYQVAPRFSLKRWNDEASKICINWEGGERGGERR